MNDAIKKMLEPKRHIGFLSLGGKLPLAKRRFVSDENFERLKRGFLLLMEQRDEAMESLASNLSDFPRHALEDAARFIKTADAELEAAMRGETKTIQSDSDPLDQLNRVGILAVSADRDALLAAHRENADEDFRGNRSSAAVRSYKAIKAHEARGKAGK